MCFHTKGRLTCPYILLLLVKPDRLLCPPIPGQAWFTLPSFHTNLGLTSLLEFHIKGSLTHSCGLSYHMFFDLRLLKLGMSSLHVLPYHLLSWFTIISLHATFISTCLAYLSNEVSQLCNLPSLSGELVSEMVLHSNYTLPQKFTYTVHWALGAGQPVFVLAI